MDTLLFCSYNEKQNRKKKSYLWLYVLLFIMKAIFTASAPHSYVLGFHGIVFLQGTTVGRSWIKCLQRVCKTESSTSYKTQEAKWSSQSQKQIPVLHLSNSSQLKAKNLSHYLQMLEATNLAPQMRILSSKDTHIVLRSLQRKILKM